MAVMLGVDGCIKWRVAITPVQRCCSDTQCATVTIIILMMKALFMTEFVFCRPLLNECHLSVFVLIFQA